MKKFDWKLVLIMAIAVTATQVFLGTTIAGIIPASMNLDISGITISGIIAAAVGVFFGTLAYDWLT